MCVMDFLNLLFPVKCGICNKISKEAICYNCLNNLYKIEKVKIINNCINNKNNLLIDYLGSSGKITKREIIPINVFEFENNIYVTAFCKLRGAMRIFTLSKITNVMKK